MLDLHVHTRHSCDSEASMEEYCKKALELNLSHICFTDHADFNRTDRGFGYYDADAFFSEFNKARLKYGDSMEILCGIEFAEPHLYRREFDQAMQHPYDFMLGSIHYWIDNMNPKQLLEADIPLDSVFARYWEEVLKAVSYGGFDSMAHIDFPKRYFGRSLWSEDYIRHIFSVMVKKGIALEINTSSLRAGLNEAMPSRAMLELYKKAGGIKVTFGADTHRAEDLASGYDFAVDMMMSGELENTVFIERRARKVPD